MIADPPAELLVDPGRTQLIGQADGAWKQWLLHRSHGGRHDVAADFQIGRLEAGKGPPTQPLIGVLKSGDELVLLAIGDVGGGAAMELMETDLADQADDRACRGFGGALEEVQVGQARAGLVEILVVAADLVEHRCRHEQAIGFR